MAAFYSYDIPADQTDLQQLGWILCQCFNAPPTDEAKYLNRLGMENVRILRDRTQIIGGLGILHLGQWYGGRRVGMAGIAAVGVKPEYRGQGAALSLMYQTVKELHEQEVPISVLYPATQTLYRKAGYEQAGLLCGWEVPTQAIRMRSSALPVEAILLDATEIEEIYQKQKPFPNGFLDRSGVIWEMKRDPQSNLALYAYRFGLESHPEGYILFQQERQGEQVEILLRDWVLLTPAAVRQCWAFLASHRSQIEKIVWKSAPVDPLTMMLSEQEAEIKSLNRWLMRIVSLKPALEQRGYAKNISAELHLEIHDSLLPRNQGKFILQVEEGHGTLIPGGRGDLQMEISGLSPLYTGLFSAEELWRCDRVSGSADILKLATELFAGSSPWMPDFF
jgi:predicted acetyltransferase